MKTIISADRTCDLTDEVYEKYPVETIPYHITLDGKEYQDNVDIFLPELFQAFTDHQSLPKTSAINVEEYVDYFTHLKEKHGGDCEIVHIALGSALTSSFQNCVIAAEQLGGIYPVDSATLSTATGLMVMDAWDMANKGMDAKAIRDYLNEHAQCYHASFILYTLEYLKAGGRCSTLAALASAALSIKPSIVVDGFKGGAMTVGKKYRGKMEKCIAQYVRDKLAMYDDIDYSCCMITYSEDVEGLETYNIAKKILEEETPFEKLYITQCSCTIGSHCGPGCIGILFRTASNCL